MKKLRIGSGAGYAGDRFEPALELIEKSKLGLYLFRRLGRTYDCHGATSLKRQMRSWDTMIFCSIAWERYFHWPIKIRPK